MRCAMTDREYPDFTDGIWDDGEWISWGWINGQLHEQELKEQFPHASAELIAVLEELVSAAQLYRQSTGRYLQIWGELGELYAQVKYGVKLHRPGAQGSDGKLDNDFVEIKTISPEKSTPRVTVKRSGHFSKLLIVRISADFEFESHLLDRKALTGSGSRARIRWPLGVTEEK